jgi:hypothetical protein
VYASCPSPCFAPFPISLSQENWYEKDRALHNEISRIKLDTKRKDGLSEALDDNIAREEQDEELEEEEAVEAAAGANRG